MKDAEGPFTPEEVVAHYGRYDESTRLADPAFGTLERLRTEQLLDRTLPPPPGTIVDVGSGPGVYSTWLAQRGYAVHALDPVAHHIEQAEQRAFDHGVELASTIVGDARQVALESGIADGVLLMGPLYHLQQRSDRLLALTEARRLLRPGGVVAVAAVSRFASIIDGLDRGFIDDPEFRQRASETVVTGRHSNPTDDPTYFTTAYFHLPEELQTEMADAGFESVTVIAVEGIGWFAPDFAERLADPQRRGLLLDTIDQLADEPTLKGISPHLLGVGTAP